MSQRSKTYAMHGFIDTDIGQDTGTRLTTAGRSEVVAHACRSIENHESTPRLDELAAEAGLSRWQLHRLFVAETGLTPKAYAAAVRADRLRNTLATGDMPVTDAIYAAGFNASSRFYETADRVLGMRARDYRAGGSGTDIHFAVGQCTLGAILVAESQRGICAILLGDDPDALVQDLQKRFPNASLTGDDADFAQRVAQVVGLVEAPGLGVDLPLDIRGTAFQERVWQALRTIPPGSTISYAELADRIGSPTAVRAVANACGANWLAVAVPCHRVVRRDGDPSGYRWGVERKQALLKRERQGET